MMIMDEHDRRDKMDIKKTSNHRAAIGAIAFFNKNICFSSPSLRTWEVLIISLIRYHALPRLVATAAVALCQYLDKQAPITYSSDKGQEIVNLIRDMSEAQEPMTCVEQYFKTIGYQARSFLLTHALEHEVAAKTVHYVIRYGLTGRMQQENQQAFERAQVSNDASSPGSV
jgi:hypothetical protein